MQAPINGGFGWNVSYKTFSLDMAFSFSLEKYKWNYDMKYTENPDQLAITTKQKDFGLLEKPRW